MDVVIGAGILLLACIGNAELWVIWVNRCHAAPARDILLRYIRKLHDLGVIAFPVFVILVAGFGDDGLLCGGTFSSQEPFSKLLLTVGLAGVIPFTVGVVRWQKRGLPSAVIEHSGCWFDVRESCETSSDRAHILGKRRSPLPWIPRNEIYNLEVTTKHIVVRPQRGSRSEVVSSTNTATDPQRVLTLAHFSDMHLIGCPGRGYHDFVTDRLCELKPDAFVFTGDLLDDEVYLPWAEDMFRRMSSVAPGYFILGNHDWHLDYDLIRSMIAKTGWTDVGSSTVSADLNDVSVLLAGNELPWIGSEPDVPAATDESLRILLSHSPDQRDFALANGFDLLLAGHTHGGQVVLPLIGPVYSPSKYGVRYAAGVFQHESLLMHVSRGIAGKDQLRWNCTPEVSLLKVALD